jgi:hypothetical protein
VCYNFPNVDLADMQSAHVHSTKLAPLIQERTPPLSAETQGPTERPRVGARDTDAERGAGRELSHVGAAVWHLIHQGASGVVQKSAQTA